MPGMGVPSDLRAMEAELADRRFTGRSANGRVAATVRGDGVLLDIAVDNRALRGSHPVEIGPAIVQAVRTARAEAGRYASELTRLVLHGEPSAAEPSAAEPPQTSRRRVRAVNDDVDELFTGFGAGGRR
jgi:DNA-binding protein YbaB